MIILFLFSISISDWVTTVLAWFNASIKFPFSESISDIFDVSSFIFFFNCCESIFCFDISFFAFKAEFVKDSLSSDIIWDNFWFSLSFICSFLFNCSSDIFFSSNISSFCFFNKSKLFLIVVFSFLNSDISSSLARFVLCDSLSWLDNFILYISSFFIYSSFICWNFDSYSWILLFNSSICFVTFG